MAITFEQFIRSLGIQESGGDYKITNPRTGAMGKYQVMPQNLDSSWDGTPNKNAGWDYEALGRDVTRQEFLNNPQIQERIALHQLKKQFTTHGPEKAALWWYSGSTNPKNMDKSPAPGEPTPRQYAASVLKRAGGQPSTLPTPQASQQASQRPLLDIPQTTFTPINTASLLSQTPLPTIAASGVSTGTTPIVNMGGQLAAPETKQEANLFSEIVNSNLDISKEPIYANAAAALSEAQRMQASVNLLDNNPLQTALTSLFDSVETDG